MLKLNQIAKLTPKIQSLLAKLEGQRIALSLIAPVPQILDDLRAKSLLQSGLYSAKIEGNPLTEATFRNSASSLHKLEVQNLLATYTWLTRHKSTPVTESFIRDLHHRAMTNLHSQAGHFRAEQSAIFDQSGLAVYLTPPPQDIKQLIAVWIANLTQPTSPTVIQPIIAHYQFEKIHPFLDGNGRTGRLLLTHGLYQAGISFADILGLERFIMASREEYYAHLAGESRRLTGFVHYFLELLTQAVDEAIPKLTHVPETPALLPRRAELLATIRDHSPCSADFLYRRFLAVPKSTIRYELLALQKLGLISKLGATRGALYSASLPE